MSLRSLMKFLTQLGPGPLNTGHLGPRQGAPSHTLCVQGRTSLQTVFVSARDAAVTASLVVVFVI